MRTEPQTTSKVAGKPADTNLSIRKSHPGGKPGCGYRKSIELMGETDLSIRSELGVASAEFALGQVPLFLSIRSNPGVASAGIALGETPSFLSIRSGGHVASMAAALGNTPSTLSIRSEMLVASKPLAMSFGS